MQLLTVQRVPRHNPRSEPPVFYLSRERPDQMIKAASPTVKIYGSGTAARLMLLEEETSPV